MTGDLSRRHLLGATTVATALATAGGTARAAAGTEAASPAASGGSAFAEHHLVLQLSDRDPHKHALVLSVANNMLKVYGGPDLIAVEVVAFGPGVDLLFADSPDRAGVDSLVSQGVIFDVCMNTINTIARESGKAPALNPKAVEVEAGVAQILKLVESGYTLVRP